MNPIQPPKKTQNSHNNPASELPPAQVPESPAATQTPSPSRSDQPDRQKNLSDLIPPSVRERRWRASSFASKLNPLQWTTLEAWLMQKGLSIEDIRLKVAAPPPEGFGMEVCATTLSRLRQALKNVAFASWIERSADIACDVLTHHENASVAPMHEALRTFLYSRALEFAREQICVEQIDKVLVAIQRLEKIRPAASDRSREPRPVSVSHHRVELAIAPNGPTPSGARIVNITSARQDVPADANSPQLEQRPVAP